jgi:hypothetical protein
MKFLGLLLIAAAFAASAAVPSPAALDSSDDVYRITPGQPQVALTQPRPAVEAPVRAVVVETRAAEPQLPARKLPAPQGWLLLVAGVALAGWMAHRRLSYF